MEIKYNLTITIFSINLIQIFFLFNLPPTDLFQITGKTDIVKKNPNPFNVLKRRINFLGT